MAVERTTVPARTTNCTRAFFCKNRHLHPPPHGGRGAAHTPTAPLRTQQPAACVPGHPHTFPKAHGAATDAWWARRLVSVCVRGWVCQRACMRVVAGGAAHVLHANQRCFHGRTTAANKPHVPHKVPGHSGGVGTATQGAWGGGGVRVCGGTGCGVRARGGGCRAFAASVDHFLDEQHPCSLAEVFPLALLCLMRGSFAQPFATLGRHPASWVQK